MRQSRWSVCWCSLAALALGAFPASAQGRGDDSATAATQQRARRVEAGLRPAVSAEGEPGASLRSRMEILGVPAVSVAVIDGGRIAWARAWGVRSAGRPEPADTATRFQAASLSKPVAAAVALTLVDRGTLALDSPVNARLGGWKLGTSSGTDAPPVTLRQLLSHSAGITAPGFRGYAAGESVPTPDEVLAGSGTANSEPIRVDGAPGRWRYSGGGYVLAQRAMEVAAGKALPVLAQERVFAPLALRSSGFVQHRDTTGNYAWGHDRRGLPLTGGWHVHPETAAAGLWSTPSDLARFMLAVGTVGSGPRRLLSDSLTAAIRTPIAGQASLGWEVEGDGPAHRINHRGANEGYRAFMVFFPATGQGAVVMTNADNGGRLIDELVRSIAEEYGWPALRAERLAATDLPDSTSLRRLVGRYRFGPGDLVAQVEFQAGQLAVSLPWAPGRKLAGGARDDFRFTDDGGTASFRRDSTGLGQVIEIPGPAGMPPIIGRREADTRK